MTHRDVLLEQLNCLGMLNSKRNGKCDRFEWLSSVFTHIKMETGNDLILEKLKIEKMAKKL